MSGHGWRVGLRVATQTPKAPAAHKPASTNVAWRQFVGQWRVGRPDGPDFIITLRDDYTAAASQGVPATGTWECFNGEAPIQWSSGNWNIIRREGSGYRKLLFVKREWTNFDGPPADSAGAVKISAGN